MTETRIQVGGERPYEVIVGTGMLGALPDLVGKSARTAASSRSAAAPCSTLTCAGCSPGR